MKYDLFDKKNKIIIKHEEEEEEQDEEEEDNKKPTPIVLGIRNCLEGQIIYWREGTYKQMNLLSLYKAYRFFKKIMKMTIEGYKNFIRDIKAIFKTFLVFILLIYWIAVSGNLACNGTMEHVVDANHTEGYNFGTGVVKEKEMKYSDPVMYMFYYHFFYHFPYFDDLIQRKT